MTNAQISYKLESSYKLEYHFHRLNVVYILYVYMCIWYNV